MGFRHLDKDTRGSCSSSGPVQHDIHLAHVGVEGGHEQVGLRDELLETVVGCSASLLLPRHGDHRVLVQ